MKSPGVLLRCAHTRISRKKLQVRNHHDLALTYIILATIQDDLVAALTSAYRFEGIDDLQAQFAPLSGLGYRNVLDMTDNTTRSEELALE